MMMMMITPAEKMKPERYAINFELFSVQVRRFLVEGLVTLTFGLKKKNVVVGAS